MTRSRQTLVFRLPTRHPADTEPLRALFASGAARPEEIVAILGKTEGNGCVNDFTRPYAVAALRALFPDDAPGAVMPAMVMSGGTEGGLSPHLLVFARRDHGAGEDGVGKDGAGEDGGKALAIGTAMTRAFAPEEVGRAAQITATAAAVRAAMAEAGLDDPADVHFVQVKCPLLTSDRVADADARGLRVATADTTASMGVSRGASALGVALALGEISPERVDDAAVGRDRALWSGRASASAGIELMHSEVVVLGNARGWTGPLRIGHAVMRDGIDLAAVLAALADAGVADPPPLPQAAAARVVAVLAKAEAAHDGRIRGLRHIMLDDSDISATRHARALVGGVIAGVIGRTDLFVSGGAEHQGPDGGGPIAIISRLAG
jgi:cyanuric acid amidohydrolase